MSDEVTSASPPAAAGPSLDERPLPVYGAGPSGRERAIALGAVVAAHLAVGWGLLQLDVVRQAVGEAAPVFVEFITMAPPPPPQPAPPPPPPPPPQPKPRPKAPPPPAPVLTAPPAPVPEPAPFVAPPPPVEPPPPAEPVVPLVPPAPPAPPVAPPPEPRTVSISQLELAAPLSASYPPQSARLGETGRVMIRVLFDATGRAVQAQVLTSSGYQRLDDAAIRAARTARIKPFLVDGQPQPVWARIPFDFNLDN